jgi:hypothetical protein
VGGVEKLQSAKLYERDVPARQLDFKRATVAGCPEEDGVLLEECTGLAVLQDALDDKACLVGLVADGNELRFGSGRPIGPEVLGKSLLGETDNAVSGGENCLRRAIIAVERDDACRWLRWATRWARVLVFPDPAPAITSSGAAANPPAGPCSTALRCSGLRVSR